MAFGVGPYTYRVEITDHELRGDDGSPLMGLVEATERRILIGSHVPRGGRLEVLSPDL